MRPRTVVNVGSIRNVSSGAAPAAMVDAYFGQLGSGGLLSGSPDRTGEDELTYGLVGVWEASPEFQREFELD